MKQFLVLLVLVLVALAVVPVMAQVANPAAGEYPIDADNPYYQRVLPNYYTIVMQRIQLLDPIRKGEMTAADLPFLEVLFSEGAMYRIFQEMPIGSWQELADIKYVSAASTSGDPRAACSEATALLLLLCFDMPFGNADNVWPWSL